MLSETNRGEEDSAAFGLPASPGSLMGSSIRSNQVHSFDIESESCSNAGENPGWRLGMPWFRNNNNNNREIRTSNNPADEVHRYYGGIMKASTSILSPNSTTSNNSHYFQSFRKSNKRTSPSKSSKGIIYSSTSNTNGNKRNERIDINDRSANSTSTNTTIHSHVNKSVPIIRTKSSTGDSIADFDDSEWTPPDSSYGAACPVCGFIPKRVRQMIEMTLIAAMIFFLIYLLVTTSMKIADAHRKEGSENASSTAPVVTDDDVYVEKYSNGDDANAVVADDNYINDGYIDDNYVNNIEYVDDANDDDDDNEGDANGYANEQDYNYNNQNYNYYNRNNRQYYRYNDDYNGGGAYRRQRQLRPSKDTDGRSRGRGEIQPVGRILDRIKRLVPAKSATSFVAH